MEPNPTIRMRAASAIALSDVVTAPMPSLAPSTATLPALRRRDTPTAVVTPLPVGGDRATISILVGPAAGASFTLGEETLIGRDETAQISVDDPAMSRLHASIERRPHGDYLLRDLDSTNGTFVSGMRVTETVLVSGDRIQIGPHFVVRFAVIDELDDALHKRMYESATRDALTSALNRRALFERLEVELLHARRTSTPLSVLMLDVDEFKLVNDTHGHLAGDRVLRALTRRVQANLRDEDLVARYGGEELVVVARATPHCDALRLSERLRRDVEALRVDFEGATIATTVSIGVASLDELAEGATVEAFLACADARLYRAKLAGRNRSCGEG